MFLEYYKVRKDVKTPERANPSDAGLDVFYCPDLNNVNFGVKGNHFTYYDKSVILFPQGNAMLPTGIKIGVPHGYVLMVANRGSMGAKKSLVFGAHIIDPGYDGEIFIDLHNISNKEQTIQPGDKIAQLLLVPCVSFRLKELDKDELYDYPIAISDRGSGALGSTDKK